MNQDTHLCHAHLDLMIGQMNEQAHLFANFQAYIDFIITSLRGLHKSDVCNILKQAIHCSDKPGCKLERVCALQELPRVVMATAGMLSPTTKVDLNTEQGVFVR